MDNKTIKKWIDNPWRISNSLARRGLLNFLSDKAYLSLMYRAAFGKKINWNNPQTFSEKLQWIKLYDRKEIYTQMVDKYASKKFVSDRVGEEYVIPLVGGPWNDPDEIDYDALPEQFVLKTNHDCGGVLICKDKSTFDRQAAAVFLREHLKRRYYHHCREWPYKDVKPVIFAEKYLSEVDSSAGVSDYKFFTFNGEPKLMYIAGGRDYAQKDKQVIYADFFDTDFNHVDLRIDHENAPECPAKPQNFDKMVECARKLAQGTKHLRVDFYEVNGKLYSGELTFFHCGGLHEFITKEWEYTMGAWICLNEEK